MEIHWSQIHRCHSERWPGLCILIIEMNTGRYPNGFWKGLLILLPVYTLLQLLYYLPEASLPRFIGSLVLSPVWLTLPFAYVLGWMLMRRWDAAWVVAVWHMVHFALVGFAMCVLFYGRFIGPVPRGIADSIQPVVGFLISPILYLGLGLLYRSRPQG